MPSSHTSDESPFAVRRGQIADWNATQGLGFADDGRQRTFVHIGDFSARTKRPQIGAVLNYTLALIPRAGPAEGIL